MITDEELAKARENVNKWLHEERPSVDLPVKTIDRLVTAIEELVKENKELKVKRPRRA
jgi:DNA anti-recombination protein RmuC